MNDTDRPTFDRHGLQIVDEETCWHLIDSVAVGRVAFFDGDKPMVLPVNHRLDEGDVVFRTAEGSKLHAALLRQPVAFEVDDWSADHQTGWSVVIQGVAEAVGPGPRLDRLAALDLEPWARGEARDHWVVIHPDAVSGRLTPRPWSDRR